MHFGKELRLRIVLKDPYTIISPEELLNKWALCEQNGLNKLFTKTQYTFFINNSKNKQPKIAEKLNNLPKTKQSDSLNWPRNEKIHPSKHLNKQPSKQFVYKKRVGKCNEYKFNNFGN